MSASGLHLRAATIADARAVWPLIVQLGYDVTEAEIRRRMGIALADDGHFLIVGESGAAVAGFMHCFQRPAIDKPFELVVQALVVDAKYRSLGVGARFMEEAERLARQTGCGSVTLSSHERRLDAHRFYRDLGYQHFATSAHFRKELPK
jgi:GNAT superfamily N-acetyltransferase